MLSSLYILRVLCSEYCTRAGLWLPFDYCDLAGSEVKNLRVISCVVVLKDLVKWRFCTISNYIMDNFDIFIPLNLLDLFDLMDMSDIFRPFNLFDTETFLTFWHFSDLFAPLKNLTFQPLITRDKNEIFWIQYNHINSNLYHFGLQCANHSFLVRRNEFPRDYRQFAARLLRNFR